MNNAIESLSSRHLQLWTKC